MSKLTWTVEDSRAAANEGWNLYDSSGMDGLVQIQRNDDQALLRNDQEAWILVRNGNRPHHIKALAMLMEMNMPEYGRVMGNPKSIDQIIHKYRGLQIKLLGEGLEVAKKVDPSESLQFLQAIGAMNEILRTLITDLENSMK
jgi:hypothetical protein